MIGILGEVLPVRKISMCTVALLSESHPVRYGVLHRSVLGPLLFLLKPENIVLAVKRWLNSFLLLSSARQKLWLLDQN